MTKPTFDQVMQWRDTYYFTEKYEGMRYGESFCRHFNIIDEKLCSSTDLLECDKIIIGEYYDE